MGPILTPFADFLHLWLAVNAFLPSQVAYMHYAVIDLCIAIAFCLWHFVCLMCVLICWVCTYRRQRHRSIGVGEEEEYSSESRLAADSMSARKRKRVVDSGGDDDSVTGAESSTQVAKVRKVNEGSPSTADSWSDAKSVGKPVSWCRVK